MTPQQAAEKDMLDRLSMMARGFDIYGRSLPQNEVMAAQKQYFDLKEQIEKRKLEEARLTSERDRLEAEQSTERLRITTQREVEHRKLDIEEERVKVQKAEVIVRALEVAVKGGANPDMLLTAIQGLSQQLLADTTDFNAKLLGRTDE